jgi:hypothetical protein
MRRKKQYGITINPQTMDRFAAVLDEHGLKISPVIEELILLFIHKLSKEIDNEQTESISDPLDIKDI